MLRGERDERAGGSEVVDGSNGVISGRFRPFLFAA